MAPFFSLCYTSLELKWLRETQHLLVHHLAAAARFWTCWSWVIYALFYMADFNHAGIVIPKYNLGKHICQGPILSSVLCYYQYFLSHENRSTLLLIGTSVPNWLNPVEGHKLS